MELPHSGKLQGVNFASGEFFNLAQLGTDKYQIIQHSDYLTVCVFTKALTAIFGYCSYTWAVQIITRVFPLCICCWFRSSGSCLSGGRGAINHLTCDAERPGVCGSQMKNLMSQRKGFRHISQCRDTIGGLYCGLPHLRNHSSASDV